jgi:glutathione peroxidase-family protein
MSTPIQQIPVRRITGEETNLGQYSGKVLLVVNVGSNTTPDDPTLVRAVEAELAK